MTSNSVLAPIKRLIPKPVKRRIKKVLGLDQPIIYHPVFDRQALTLSVQRYLSAQPKSAAARGSTGHKVPASFEDAVEYFRQRQGPAYFADSSTLRRLAEYVTTQRPEWRKRMLAAAHSDCADGLRLYAITAPPLQPGFPWCAMHEGSNDDDLYVSRAHRFPFAPRHGLAILYGEEPPSTLAEILEDWMRAMSTKGCPWAYESLSIVMERMVALGWAHAFVTAAPSASTADSIRLQSDILLILHADMQYLAVRIGTSYPNGHLLGDLYAAWYFGLVLPEFMPESTDLDANDHAWLAELDRQIYPDGTGFEPAIKYHQGICQMAAAYVILNRRNDRPVPLASLQQIERMLAFEVELAGPYCEKWFIGDGIETSLFSLDTGSGWGTGTLRELYRALFRPDFSPAPDTDPAVERAFWLLGGELAPSPATPSTAPECRSRAWLDGGFSVFPDAALGARLVFRTGPAQHRDVIAGHMHADLLSVCVNQRAQPVLIDAGTYTYRFRHDPGHPGRAYFSGPASHNGLCLDQIDPLGDVVGDFRPGDSPMKVVTQAIQLASSMSWLEGELRGKSIYGGYRRGVVHIAGMYWIVYDYLPGAASAHAATLGFQTAPGVEVNGSPEGTIELRSSSGSMWLCASPGLAGPKITSGEHDPESGWVSPSYGTLIAAPQLRYAVDSNARMTAFTLGTDTAPMRPVSIHALRQGIAIQMESTNARDLVLLATHPDGIQIGGGTEFNGEARALWLRSEAGKPRALRCVGYQDAAALPPKNPVTGYRCTNPPRELREFCQTRLDDLSITFCGAQWRRGIAEPCASDA